MDIEISQFTDEDIAFGKELTDSEDWNRGESDWRRLLLLEPDGFFKATVKGVKAGMVGSIRYDRVAWINSLIVRREFRGRHIGEALMKRCLDHVTSSGATSIKLDSIQGVEPFYERFGFRTEFPSLRFLGNVKDIIPPRMGFSRPRLDEVLTLDRKEMGIDRGRIIRALFEDPTGRCFAYDGDKGLNGYLLTRQAQGRVDLGPCVVKDTDLGTAEDLLRAATISIPSETFKLCVPGKNGDVADMIRSIGFEQFEGPTRMWMGVPFEEPVSIVSMMSPEKG